MKTSSGVGGKIPVPTPPTREELEAAEIRRLSLRVEKANQELNYLLGAGPEFGPHHIPLDVDLHEILHVVDPPIEDRRLVTRYESNLVRTQLGMAPKGQSCDEATYLRVKSSVGRSQFIRERVQPEVVRPLLEWRANASVRMDLHDWRPYELMLKARRYIYYLRTHDFNVSTSTTPMVGAGHYVLQSHEGHGPTVAEKLPPIPRLISGDVPEGKTLWPNPPPGSVKEGATSVASPTVDELDSRKQVQDLLDAANESRPPPASVPERWRGLNNPLDFDAILEVYASGLPVAGHLVNYVCLTGTLPVQEPKLRRPYGVANIHHKLVSGGDPLIRNRLFADMPSDDREEQETLFLMLLGESLPLALEPIGVRAVLSAELWAANKRLAEQGIAPLDSSVIEL